MKATVPGNKMMNALHIDTTSHPSKIIITLGGRVKVRAELGLSINPIQVVEVSMIEI